jgi:ribose-phosphate pyrophosphokinase
MPQATTTAFYGRIELIAGTAHPELAQEIADYLTRKRGDLIQLAEVDISRFDNGNIFVRLGSSVRGQDVYVIQTTSPPVNDNLMELLITIDTLKRDSAGRITAVFPYLCYGRSDKKDLPRVPITARLVAEMIQVAGADRYMTIDLHAGQIQGFFSIPGDVLTAFHMLSDYFDEKNLEDAVIVTADLGFAKRGRNWASKLKAPTAFIEKRRLDGAAEALTLIGDVEGKNAIIVDDEVDTAGTLSEAVGVVNDAGAKSVCVAFTHGVFSGEALDRLAKLDIEEIVFTDTISLAHEDRLPNMTILGVAELLGEVILRAHEGRSVGELFHEVGLD